MTQLSYFNFYTVANSYESCTEIVANLTFDADVFAIFTVHFAFNFTSDVSVSFGTDAVPNYTIDAVDHDTKDTNCTTDDANHDTKDTNINYTIDAAD